MRTASAARLSAVAALCLLASGCGQKGPPLAPLRLVPGPVTDVAVRRVADRVRLRFVLPTANANGPGPIELDHVEIYAMTLPPGAPPPANRVILDGTYAVGRIPVRPAVEDQPAVEGDTRPEPGTAVTFDEELTEAVLTPVRLPELEKALEAAARAAGPAPGADPLVPVPGLPSPVPGTPYPPAAAKPPAPPVSKDPVRVYAVRGVTRGGRFGPPARVQVPIVPVPPAPADVAARFTETAVVVDWKAPADAPPGLTFNVYRADDPMQPVNLAPVTTTTFEFAAMTFGTEYCFSLRSVAAVGVVPIEGALSGEACVTPRDVFAPAAPVRLDAVPTPGQISLIWEANTEKDLAGYLVLRGDAPDGPLQPITQAPISETTYRDETVKPGARYVYAIVAVDSAQPPNASPQSPRVEETAR
jgi:hypothetical protein